MRHAVKKEITRLYEVVKEFGVRRVLKAMLHQRLGVVNQAAKSEVPVAQDRGKTLPATSAQQAPGGRGELPLEGAGWHLLGIQFDLAVPGVAQQPVQAVAGGYAGCRQLAHTPALLRATTRWLSARNRNGKLNLQAT